MSKAHGVELKSLTIYSLTNKYAPAGGNLLILRCLFVISVVAVACQVLNTFHYRQNIKIINFNQQSLPALLLQKLMITARRRNLIDLYWR
jgi:hypothetical protein